MPGEFELIRLLERAQTLRRDEVTLGIGDDAALLKIPDNQELVVSTDTLNIGIHFPEDTSPEAIGYKLLAVNLSDLAAMGAKPVAVTLSLSLPDASDTWLREFARGFFRLANEFNVQLIGGDTTQGPLSVSATIFGSVPQGRAIKRSGARPGELICVTGTLGDAAAGLLALQGELKLTRQHEAVLVGKLDQPYPRIAVGRAIRGLATACIDISDGLSADLGHILDQSHVGAMLYVDQIPISETYRHYFDQVGGWDLPLKGGDDYELCFTIPEDRQDELERIIPTLDVPITYIGVIESSPGVQLMNPDISVETIEAKGYEHFSKQ